MITRDPDAFLRFARGCAPDFGPATAKAAFLVAPEGFARAEQSAADNRYMAGADDFDAARALVQHRALQAAMAEILPTVCFPGDRRAPDGLFPNNAFATVPGRLVVGRMRHPVRQREAARTDIRGFFAEVLGYAVEDLSAQPHPCELTGALVIDRARGLGFCGLSERCDAEGAALMHHAFGLRATLLFELAPGEYHTNVVLAVLAGRAALLCDDGLADPRVAAAIAALYAPHVARLGPGERASFAGNALALSAGTVWMSEAGGAALAPPHRDALARAGFGIRTVPLDAIEAGGGSLRCCIAEIY
ncbi:arginine deiminase-related protein [Luteimonas sp. RD2P54]|uniref:Arginine deiminase-related protein n=1 Tax=Luteimonas endophytica TaxID=3042023 RepID=A0ABT6J8A9_9GAMM|nr:arginine deiminase-related protein [Luteimonas endophytica]MDH5823061.1 arginine deiminase-related protein [Luteimonas endophytica]